jgi:hypothetical protein
VWLVTFCVLTLTFTLFNISKKLMFITQRSTPTYFFGTDTRSHQKPLKAVPTSPYRWDFQKILEVNKEERRSKWGMTACRSAWRASGCTQHECLCGSLRVHVVPTQSCVNSWSSCLLQCRTYPASRETAVHLEMWGPRKSAVVGQFSSLCWARTKFM